MFRFRRPRVNRVVLTLVYADMVFYLAVGLVSPIIAVYYTDYINGGNLAVAGFATALFWVVKSAVQVPVSLYADNHKGELDDHFLMVTGYLIAALVPLMYYLFVREVWQVYLMEALRGIGYAMLVPTFLSMFTRHIDKQKENFEWMLHSNAVGLGFAAAAAIGGVLAQRFGFGIMFLLTSAMMFIAPVMLLFIRKELSNSGGYSDPSPEVVMQREKLPNKN